MSPAPTRSASDPAAVEAQATRSVLRLLGDHGVALARQRVLAMCSGGLDSVVLVSLLATLHAGARPRELHVLWLDHGLRDTSADRAAAEQVAAAHGLQLHERVWQFGRDLPGGPGVGGNLQARARAWRYGCALRVAKELGCGLVATGHHADDQLETMLYGLVAHGGPRGLGGIPVVGQLGAGVQVVRPLLGSSREAIAELAAARGLGWAEDPTNDESRFRRNWLRQRVVPALLQTHPGAGANLARTQRQLAGREQLVAQLAAELLARICDERGGLDVRELTALDASLQRELVAQWLRAGGVGRAVGSRAIEAVCAMVARGAAAASGAGAGVAPATQAGSLGPTVQLRRACVRLDRYHVRIELAAAGARPATTEQEHA